MASIQKKGDKKILKNYRPTSFLSITGKILERLLYDRMSLENNLIHIINQVLNQVIHVLINFFLSPMKCINLLMIILMSELLF